jgi:hypothetical protein
MLHHEFRRSGVKVWNGPEFPVSIAMKFSGHKTKSIHSRYAIVTEHDIQDATRRRLVTIWAHSPPHR